MWPKKSGEVIERGTKFNSWTVIEEVSIQDRPNKRERYVKVICDCGTEDIINFKNLKYGKSKTCVKCRSQKAKCACTKQWEPIDIDGYFLIPLSGGKYAKIDKDDLELVRPYNWCIYVGYAGVTNDKGILMHRLINKTENGMCTHHINGNKLDNRKINLETMSRIDHIKHHHDTIHHLNKGR